MSKGRVFGLIKLQIGLNVKNEWQLFLCISNTWEVRFLNKYTAQNLIEIVHSGILVGRVFWLNKEELHRITSLPT